MAHVLQAARNAPNRPLLGASGGRAIGRGSGGIDTSLGRQSDGAGRAVLLEDTTVDDSLVDAGGLEGILGDVSTAVDSLLQDAKVVLALATDVVGQGLGDLCERVASSRVEDLGRAVGLNVSQCGISQKWRA